MSARFTAVSIVVFVLATAAAARAADVTGLVRDETGGALPGVTVELRGPSTPQPVVTDAQGAYRVRSIAPGTYQVVFTLINFATVRRAVDVGASAPTTVDVVMHLALNADVTVTGKRTFANLADVENPAENLVGIAQAASQGAITAQQLETRPLMREGEVLETVPGVIVAQHSGEGKANQYFLRGFNLDHGTDFATTVAGMPINLPTHAHGQGYTDINFLIPELVTGVQFSKGPYYADQGDFATAGSTNINYANVLDKPIANIEGGAEGYGRALFAASPKLGAGHVVAAFEFEHNNGPWVHADNYRKLNGVLRYSQGDAVNGFSLTGLAYAGKWNATDQVADRAIQSGAIGRFGSEDPSDGGDTYRYSAIADWQHGSGGNASTRITAYASAYDLHLFSNFTYFLEDPIHGDQIEQADHRYVTGAKATHRRTMKWAGRSVQNTFGVQVRNDDITNIGLYHTEARVRLDTRSQAAVMETSGGLFAQNEIEWTPWLRTIAGIRGDAVRFDVDTTKTASLVSPKGGVALGPWKRTEFYVNAGTGFHSNDARGDTTPLVRAKGAEVGVRSVAIPHLQTTFTLWTLRLDSELVFAGDQGTTEAGRPSARTGIEFANYYSPRTWLIFDGDVSWSRSRFSDDSPAGNYVPEAVGTVLSAGATVEHVHKLFGSVRWRYFGPRTLIENNSVRSDATSLANVQGGYQLARNVRVALDVFNLFNAADSDIDYFYTSRLSGEPLGGIADIHTHPTLPRTARVTFIVGF